ncbi:hypothetical protein CP974_21745 [Streptomyces fradiae ATCC 10745 = DSM 40063]|nr:hypothetical protein CP974_21745 [Streptomyces fradiae ATCC 10745 = DSM 40063]
MRGSASVPGAFEGRRPLPTRGATGPRPACRAGPGPDILPRSRSPRPCDGGAGGTGGRAACRRPVPPGLAPCRPVPPGFAPCRPASRRSGAVRGPGRGAGRARVRPPPLGAAASCRCGAASRPGPTGRSA